MWVLGTGRRVQPFAPRLSSSAVLYGVDQIDASWMDEQVFVVQKELDHVQAVQNRRLWTSCNMAVTEDAHDFGRGARPDPGPGCCGRIGPDREHLATFELIGDRLDAQHFLLGIQAFREVVCEHQESRLTGMRDLLAGQGDLAGRAWCQPEDDTIDVALLEHVSPIEWDNVILYGQYVLDRSPRSTDLGS